MSKRRIEEDCEYRRKAMRRMRREK